MASTYRLGEALELLQTQIKSPDLTPFAPKLLDGALSFMWDFADWRGSLAELPPFFLLPDEQDYGPPLLAVPTDFAHLRWAQLRDVDSVTVNELAVRAHLEVTDLYDIPDAISYEPEIGKFRVHPCPTGTMVPSRWQVEGRYKKRHTKVVTTNINSLVLPWDDQYFGVFRKVLKWKWLEEIDSPAAGQMNYLPDGSITATGQAASVLSSISYMVAREGLNDAPEQLAPSVDLFL